MKISASKVQLREKSAWFEAALGEQVLRQCRKALAQRNANPQMVAERALRALAEVEGGLSQGADER